MTQIMEDKKAHVAEISRRLKKLYPDAHVELDYSNAFELMIASILAAQNTDVNINKLTPMLFRKYRGPEDYLKVPPSELEQDIHKSGFFRQKTKSIQAVSKRLVEDFGGELPRTMDEMLSLPGIGRKTANVVLGNALGVVEGIVVDTHNIRLAGRLGLSEQKTADKIERDLMEIVPKKDWVMFSHWITWHGRRVCHARSPKCAECVLNDICPSSMV
jgi:endonuclease-3